MRKNSSYKVCSLIAVACAAMLSLTACGNALDAVNNEAGSGMKDAGNSQKSDVQGSGAGNSQDGSSSGNQRDDIVAVNAEAVNVTEIEDLFTDRDLKGEFDETECIGITLTGDSAQCDSKTVSVFGGTVVISGEGVYLLSGSLEEGMIIVEAPDTAKVQLVLAGASVSNSSNAAIYVKSADKVFVTLAEGTVNKLENGGSYIPMDDNNIDGVIFSKCDLTINGSGSLAVTAAAGHGIVTKDDLRVTGGSIDITAAGHGLSGKDSVRIAAGTVSVISGKDGIRSEHDTNEEKGYVYIGGGEFTVVSEGDGISASKTVQIDGGRFVITAGGGSTNKTIARNSDGDEVSTKGIKGAGTVVINDGEFVIDSQDDALHSNASLMVNGGEFQIATGDDGLHADETTTVSGGYIDISNSYEGIEGNNVVIEGGTVRLYASDDGINAAGGRDQSGFGGFFGQDRFGGGSDSSLLISGGIIYVNADGDGVDSNGTLIVAGGELYIAGPENSANGALDYETDGQITGGIVVATGNSGMAMNFGNTSTQGSILVSVPSQTAGAEITVRDEDGKTLITYVAESFFNSVVVSCPEMVQGGTYTILAGDSEQTVTLESLIYGNGMGGFGGGGGRGGWGGPKNGDGFGDFGNPGGMEPPEGQGDFRERGGFGGSENPGGMEPPENQGNPVDEGRL